MTNETEVVHPIDAAEVRLKRAARQFCRTEWSGTENDTEKRIDEAWLEMKVAARNYGEKWLRWTRENEAAIEADP